MRVLNKAVAYWRASDFSGQNEDEVLFDGSGNAHHAQFGSTPTPFIGPDKYGVVCYQQNNTLGHKVSWADNAAWDFSTSDDLDLRVAVALKDWSGFAANQWIISNYHQASGGFGLGILTTGQLRLAIERDAGGGSVNFTATSNPSATDDEMLILRVTLDADNGSSDADAYFYTKTSTPANAFSDMESDTGWTQLGNVVNAGSTVTIGDSTDALDIGAWAAGGTNIRGRVYAVQFADTILGTPVFKVDFTSATEGDRVIVESANSLTGTLSTTGADTNDPTFVDDDTPYFTLATDDYFDVEDHADLDFALADDLTIAVLYSADDGTPSADEYLAAKVNIASGAGWALYHDNAGAGRFWVTDGTNSDHDESTALTQDERHLIVGRRDTTADEIEAGLDDDMSGSPTTDPTTGTLANALNFVIGAQNEGGANYANGKFYGAAVFDSALSDGEIKLLTDELLGLNTDKLIDLVGNEITKNDELILFVAESRNSELIRKYE